MPEVRKQIELNDTITLLDLNGEVTSFKSEFIITAKNPSRKFLAAIVNQNDLDNESYVLAEESSPFARKVSLLAP